MSRAKYVVGQSPATPGVTLFNLDEWAVDAAPEAPPAIHRNVTYVIVAT
jgi:hypothetical protein